MSLEERIKTAVTPVVPEFAADVYTGDADSYCVLNATEMPDGFGDNRPRAIRYALVFPAADGSQSHQAGAAGGHRRPAELHLANSH